MQSAGSRLNLDALGSSSRYKCDLRSALNIKIPTEKLLQLRYRTKGTMGEVPLVSLASVQHTLSREVVIGSQCQALLLTSRLVGALAINIVIHAFQPYEWSLVTHGW